MPFFEEEPRDYFEGFEEQTKLWSDKLRNNVQKYCEENGYEPRDTALYTLIDIINFAREEVLLRTEK